jgi:hypothetical protein
MSLPDRVRFRIWGIQALARQLWHAGTEEGDCRVVELTPLAWAREPALTGAWRVALRKVGHKGLPVYVPERIWGRGATGYAEWIEAARPELGVRVERPKVDRGVGRALVVWNQATGLIVYDGRRVQRRAGRAAGLDAWLVRYLRRRLRSEVLVTKNRSGKEGAGSGRPRKETSLTLGTV